MKKKTDLLSERVNLRSALLAILLFGSGLLLMLWAANKAYWAQNTTIQSFIETLGSSLLVTGLITVAWDLFGKRVFAEELLTKVAISKELMSAGIIQVTSSFQSKEIDWDILFDRVTQVDLLFLGSSTWRNHNFRQLESFVMQSSSQLRVILPDPNDEHTMKELANRMNMSLEDQIQRTSRAVDFFQKLSQDFPKSHIDVCLIKKSPLFSVFRFDNRAVVSFYSHRSKLVEIPTIICVEGGNIFKYIMDEIEDCIISNGIVAKSSSTNQIGADDADISSTKSPKQS